MFLKIKQGNLNIDFIFTWWLTDRNIISILLHLFLPNKIFWILHLIILSKRMKGTTSCKYNMSHPKLQWQEWVKKKMYLHFTPAALAYKYMLWKDWYTKQVFIHLSLLYYSQLFSYPRVSNDTSYSKYVFALFLLLTLFFIFWFFLIFI